MGGTQMVANYQGDYVSYRHRRMLDESFLVFHSKLRTYSLVFEQQTLLPWVYDLSLRLGMSVRFDWRGDSWSLSTEIHLLLTTLYVSFDRDYYGYDIEDLEEDE